jgi:hypothetical protein
MSRSLPRRRSGAPPTPTAATNPSTAPSGSRPVSSGTSRPSVPCYWGVGGLADSDQRRRRQARVGRIWREEPVVQRIVAGKLVAPVYIASRSVGEAGRRRQDMSGQRMSPGSGTATCPCSVPDVAVVKDDRPCRQLQSDDPWLRDAHRLSRSSHACSMVVTRRMEVPR